MSILKGDNPQGVGRLGSCGSDTAGAACSCHFHFRVQFGHSPMVSVVGQGLGRSILLWANAMGYFRERLFLVVYLRGPLKPIFH